MLVWLASYPRSGNRFFRWVAKARYGMPERDKNFPPKEGALKGELIRTLEQVVALPEPVLVKTHEFPTDDTFPAVYLVRDGRDAVVSYTHFALTVMQKRPPEEVTPALFRDTLRDLLLEERSAYGSWAENVSAWAGRPGVVVVRYEDLVRDPGGVADRALAAAGCPAVKISDELPTFEGMKKESGKLVRRGQPGSWRDEFPPDLLPLFWRKNGDAMRRFGYTDGELRGAA